MQTVNRLLKEQETSAIIGIGKSSHFEGINEGIYPPPVSICDTRSKRYPLHETEQVRDWIIAGLPKEEIRRRVAEMVANRALLGEAA